MAKRMRVQTSLPDLAGVATRENRKLGLGRSMATAEASQARSERRPRSQSQSSTKTFLEVCFSCKKPIESGSTIYMLGDFRAFCSHKCRDKVLKKEGVVV